MGHTGVVTPPVADPPANTADPKPPHSPAVRRLVLGLALLAAIGLFVLAGRMMDTGSSGNVSVSGDVVERLIPADGDEALSQSPVALDLATGWGLELLVLNGTEVPEIEWDVTAPLGLYEFLPADGKSVEALRTGENCATATIFRLADLSNTRVVTWCFDVF
jgi:hypothetical protein